jgi:tRNA dimethylallyltransferase
MQIYRRMDIGTDKATAEERKLVPHHMLDVAEPEENYSVSRYVEEASRCCDELLARGKLPVIVGGTGLYIDSLLSGRDFAGREEGDESLRRALGARYDAEGGEALLKELASFDPQRAEKLHPSDRRRIIRAIEIYRLTGETATAHDLATRQRPKRFDAARIVLNYRDRAALYARIDRRVEDMVAAGLFEEVEGLLEGGLSADCTAMQAIGYKEAAQHLRGELSRDEAIALIQQGSRRYAKRQITWFGRWEDALRILWDREPDFQDALLSSTAFLRSRGYAVFV